MKQYEHTTHFWPTKVEQKFSLTIVYDGCMWRSTDHKREIGSEIGWKIKRTEIMKSTRLSQHHIYAVSLIQRNHKNGKNVINYYVGISFPLSLSPFFYWIKMALNIQLPYIYQSPCSSVAKLFEIPATKWRKSIKMLMEKIQLKLSTSVHYIVFR
jgi:hypothetical protein